MSCIKIKMYHMERKRNIDVESIHISDWDAKYEVSVKGRPWTPGDDKRKGPLEFIRCHCHGKSQSPGFRRLLSLADEKAAECYGVFIKLLDLAADEPGNVRNGTIYNEHGEPASVDDISWLTGFSVDVIHSSIAILSDPALKWIEIVRREVSGKSGVSRIAPESPGTTPIKSTHNKTNQTKQSGVAQKDLAPRTAISRDLDEDSVVLKTDLGASPPDKSEAVTVPLNGKWSECRQAVFELFPKNQSIHLAMSWLASQIMAEEKIEVAVIQRLTTKLQECRGPKCKHPPALFMAELKRIGYRSKGTK